MKLNLNAEANDDTVSHSLPDPIQFLVGQPISGMIQHVRLVKVDIPTRRYVRHGNYLKM